MSTASRDDGRKVIQASVAITCGIVCYVLIKFFETLSEWFELEAKMPHYNASSQILSVLIALGIFTYIIRNPKTSTFLNEVYAEAIKVVWPDKNDTGRQTIVIMILVTLIGFVLGLFDLGASWLLSLIA